MQLPRLRCVFWNRAGPATDSPMRRRLWRNGFARRWIGAWRRLTFAVATPDSYESQGVILRTEIARCVGVCPAESDAQVVSNR